MPDREDVIRSLINCMTDEYECSDECQYFFMPNGCVYSLMMDAAQLLKDSELIVKCKDCKHLFDGEHTENCCDVLMEKAGWLKEISVSPDWFCADGERR